MTIGIQSGGVDLDTIFLARSHTKIADIGIQANGTDISNNYEPVSYGYGPVATGILAAGADLNTLFASSATLTVAITKYPNPFSSSPQYLSFVVTSMAGGTGPYTYLWSVTNLSGDGSITLTSVDTASTAAVTMIGSYDGPTFGNVELQLTDSMSHVATATSRIYMNSFE